MKQMKPGSSVSKKHTGFTIVEVLIVLAVASLIMLIVFGAVPAMNRNSRNYGRKRYAEYLAGILEEYKGNYNHYVYDGTVGPDDRCSFINALLQNGISCTNNIAKDCQLAKLTTYDVCFHDRYTAHTYIPPLDEMSIAFGHLCNSPDAADYATKPIIGNDSNTNHYAIWIQIELGPAFCVDNGS